MYCLKQRLVSSFCFLLANTAYCFFFLFCFSLGTFSRLLGNINELEEGQ